MAKQSPRRSSASVGLRLKELRKRRQLTQAELAKKLDVHRSLIAQYEGGYLRLHADLIMRIAEILHISPNELLGSEPLKAERPLANRGLLRRFRQVDRLPLADQKALARFLDALLERHGLGQEKRSMRTPTKAAKRSRGGY
jgi:transcriptional regulator with XRE-family HTH domain